MKKSIFKELVFQAAHANRPSTDFVVLRSDIDAYIPAVVNFALTKVFYTQKNSEGNGDIPTQFYQYYNNLPILTDSDRNNKPYFLMPALIVALPSDRSLRSVLDNCDNPYTSIKDQQMSNLKYWLNIFCNEHFYRKEGKKVYLYNKPALTETMNIIAIVEASELNDEDEIQLPAGTEKDAIDMCVDFVLGIKQLPVDRKTDDRSIN